MWGASFAEMFYKNLNVKIHCKTNVKLVFQEILWKKNFTVYLSLKAFQVYESFKLFKIIVFEALIASRHNKMKEIKGALN